MIDARAGRHRGGEFLWNIISKILHLAGEAYSKRSGHKPIED
jgi:hypothetical protein